jgi:hypothetical protein
MPNGTAHTARSSTVYGGTPRHRSRTSVMMQASTIPMTMQIAYARSGIGPRCQTAVPGLGIEAR